MKLCSTCHKNFSDEETRCPDHGETLRVDSLIGASLSSFKITGWLGEGGMGVLYKAEHEMIGRRAAVKIIRREILGDEKMASRFEIEARAVARIGHPHLIDIFDIGTTTDGRLYYVMELLEGRSLAARHTQERLSFSDFATIMVDACQALEAAHALGIVHRDLKPDNIFLVERPGEPPFVKVLDFGIAKVLGTDEGVQNKLTKTGSIIGTPAYMAPEQVAGGAIDSRADVYALGIILFELAMGRTPFVAENMGGLLVAHMLERPPRFSAVGDAKIAPGLAPSLEAVIFRALVKKPVERYQTVRELREELERLLAGQAPLAEAWFAAETAKWSAEQTIPGAHMTFPGGPGVGPTMPGGAMPTVQQTLAGAHLPPPPSRARTAILAAAATAAAAVLAVVAFNRLKPAPPPPPPAPRVVEAPPPAALKKKRGPDVAALRSRAIGVISTLSKDGDPVVRKQAAETIVEGRDARHHSMVEPLLGDGDLQVRAAAAKAIEKLGSRASLIPLRTLFGKEAALDPFVGEALSRLGDEKDRKKVLEQLKKELKSGADADRFQAALVLSDLGYKDAQKLLAKVVKLSEDDKKTVVMVLGRLADRDAAARSRLEEMQAGEEPMLALQAARELARLGDDKTRDRLTSLASQKDLPGGGRLLAYRVLASLDDHSGYDLFASTFRDTDRPVAERILSAQGLGASGERSALETVSPALDEGEPALRLAAAGAVLAIAAADPKIMAATSLDWASDALADGSWAVRAQAAAVLADANSAEAVPMLKKLLHDDDVEVRRAAVTALGKSKSSEATEALGEALEDKTSDVRLLAVRELGESGGEQATAILDKLMATAVGEEKALAAGELVKLGKRDHVDALKDALSAKDPETRRVAVEQAAADPTLGAETLATALKDKAGEVRLQAAVSLADRGSKDGVDVLQKAVKKGGADGLKAYVALTRLDVEPTAKLDPETLLDAKDRRVREKAVEIAGTLPVAKAIPFYKHAIHDQDPTIRMLALGKIGQLATGSGAKVAMRLLRQAMNDADAGVRARAESLVAKYSPKAAPEPEDEPAKPAANSPGPAVPAADLIDLGHAALLPDMAPLANSAMPDLALPVQAAAILPVPIPEPAPVPVPPTPAPVVVAPVPAKRPAPQVFTPPPPELTTPGAMRDEARVAAVSAEVALQSRKWNDAIKEYHRAQKLDPGLNVWFGIAEAYRNLGEHEDDPARQKDDFEKAVASYRRSNKPRAVSFATELEQRVKGGNE